MSHDDGSLTNIELAKAALLRDGKIEAYDAVYTLTDPDGRPHRNTRLATTIHTLRHRDGWDIETIQKPGQLATYILRSAPAPRAKTVVYYCPKCGSHLIDPTPTLDPRWAKGRCFTCSKPVIGLRTEVD